MSPQDVWRWWSALREKEVDPLLWRSHCHNFLCSTQWLWPRLGWRWGNGKWWMCSCQSGHEFMIYGHKINILWSLVKKVCGCGKFNSGCILNKLAWTENDSNSHNTEVTFYKKQNFTVWFSMWLAISMFMIYLDHIHLYNKSSPAFFAQNLKNSQWVLLLSKAKSHLSFSEVVVVFCTAAE